MMPIEREEGIVRIEKDIVEINTIFKDLAELVNEQGSKLGMYKFITVQPIVDRVIDR